MIEKQLLKVNPKGKLELPPEVQTRLKPGDIYVVSLTEDAITLKKVQEDNVNLEDFFQRLETIEPDPHQPSLAEISKMVKEARKQR
jgi:hypothetical protein